MREIGGYIEFEENNGNEFYQNALALNCARNCLSYLNKSRHIHKLYIPYFLCNTVKTVCDRDGVIIEYYHINERMRPKINKTILDNEWIYIVNYYGQISNAEIIEYKNKYERVIIDNVQAFFQKPINGIDTIYTCRKFFGVPDGAYLFCDLEENDTYTPMEAWNRMNHLFGRYEKGADKFYKDYIRNEEIFTNSPILGMSTISSNLLRSYNYDKISKRRENNFTFLHNELKTINKLNLQIPIGAFMYPLFVENGARLRNFLIKEKIYVPILWPDVFEICNEEDLEYQYALNILPLPIDQRYRLEDMKIIVEKIYEYKNLH